MIAESPEGPREKIQAMFEAPFSTYEDFAPRASNPERCNCHPFGAKFARIIAQVDVHAFSAGAVERASAFVDAAGPYVASTEISRVLRFILRGASSRGGEDAEAVAVVEALLPPDMAKEVVARRANVEFRDLVAGVVGARGRFVREMCIEYNHIELQETFDVLESLDDLARVIEAVEHLKSECHSAWRNNRDFEWIAKDRPDVRMEYRALDRRSRVNSS